MNLYKAFKYRSFMEGLSLVVPIHNGEEVIEKSIKEYYESFSKKFKNFEIIAVCNGCRDNSAKICHSLKSTFPIKVIEITQSGKGLALVSGFNNCKFDYIGFLDGDNPFDLDKIIKMIDYLKDYDVVISTKYLRGKAKTQDSCLRRLISLGGGIFSRIIFNLNFRDTQAGAKFMKREVWRSIDRKFICIGFDFDIELLYKLKKSKFKIVEVYTPVIKKEKFSTLRLKYLPSMIYRLIKLKFKK